VAHPRHLAQVSIGALLAVAVAARPATAHGFGQRYDLPVPLALWIAGAAAAVALSFIVIGLFMRGGSGGRDYPRLNLLRWPLARVLADRRTVLVVRALSVSVLMLVVAAGVAGDQNPTRNLAPVMVWVIWWVGFAYISALAGNLWAVFNPWAAIFRWMEELSVRRGGVPLALGVPYPPRLGMWPAIVLFAAFAWAELVYTGRAIPARLALMTVVYSVITWTGMALFGRAVWLARGDPFAAAFSLLARFGPTEIRVKNRSFCQRCPSACGDGDACVDCGECFGRATPAEREWNLRPFGAGLLRTGDVSPSMIGFVLLLLATVAFDGFTATPAWARLESMLYAALAPVGDLRVTVIGTLGLVAFPVAFVLVYGLFAGWMASAAGSELSTGTVARMFVLSLVPIAIAYHLAHYLTYLLIQGQLVIRLASDPFGLGWNLLGTARYRPDVGIVGARFAWYTAVVAIVLGHIIAVYIAHVIALREFSDRRGAMRSQLPMLVLMVGYTMISLWIIAQPIVETSPKG
jgi:hypothetical protein